LTGCAAAGSVLVAVLVGCDAGSHAASTATSSSGASGAGASALNSSSSSSGVPAPFADLFTDAVGQVNHLDDQARATVDGLMTGRGVDVHQAMISTEKADMAFELTLAVRNKAVQAYQTVIGMQF